MKGRDKARRAVRDAACCHFWLRALPCNAVGAKLAYTSTAANTQSRLSTMHPLHSNETWVCGDVPLSAGVALATERVRGP